jgi:hypothetical protein
MAKRKSPQGSLRSVDGKLIGTLDAGVFTKKVRGSIHRVRTPPGWAIDKLAYDEHLVGKCHTIVIVDTEAHLRYTVSFAKFDEKKILMNRGYGAQYLLVLLYWQVSSDKQTYMFRGVRP